MVAARKFSLSTSGTIKGLTWAKNLSLLVLIVGFKSLMTSGERRCTGGCFRHRHSATTHRLEYQYQTMSGHLSTGPLPCQSRPRRRSSRANVQTGRPPVHTRRCGAGPADRGDGEDIAANQPGQVSADGMWIWDGNGWAPTERQRVTPGPPQPLEMVSPPEASAMMFGQAM